MSRHRRPGRLTSRWDRVPGAYRASLFFAALAALAGWVTAMDHERTNVLDREGRVTTATVVEVDRWVKGGPMAEVRFETASGMEVVTTLQEFAWRSTEPGDRVTVQYAARDPYYYVRDPAAAGSEVRFYGTVTAGSVLLTVLVPLLRRPVLRLQARDAARRQARAAVVPGAALRPRYRTWVDAHGNARAERVD